MAVISEVGSTACPLCTERWDGNGIYIRRRLAEHFAEAHPEDVVEAREALGDESYALCGS